MAELCEWSNIKKITYAKRLLHGLAELFVSYEKCRNWLEIKQTLRFKFSQAVDAHKIHKELSRRTKKANVSHQKYIYKMLHIASECNGGNKSVKDVSSTSGTSRKRRLEDAQINNFKLVAFIDSGSALN
ncbi:hypothetical protein ANTRET_LOCUS1406 [Anthophora retusa]